MFQCNGVLFLFLKKGLTWVCPRPFGLGKSDHCWLPPQDAHPLHWPDHCSHILHFPLFQRLDWLDLPYWPTAATFYIISFTSHFLPDLDRKTLARFVSLCRFLQAAKGKSCSWLKILDTRDKLLCILPSPWQHIEILRSISCRTSHCFTPPDSRCLNKHHATFIISTKSVRGIYEGMGILRATGKILKAKTFA